MSFRTLAAALVALSLQAAAPIEYDIVPFSHLDLTWMGTARESESRFCQILGDAIAKANRNPRYRFLVDNAYFLERFLALRPEQTASLKRLVANGQIEVNAVWALPHTDDSAGEGNDRNILYAKRFIKEAFGVDSRIVSYTDLPEWMPQTPQILRGAGIDFLVMTRLGPRDVPLLWWKGLDGSRILTANIWYGGWSLFGLGITEDAATMKAAGLADFARQSAASFKCSPPLATLGIDVFLPVENLERNVDRWNAQSGSVKLRLTTLHDYYRRIRSRSDLPEFQGEVPDSWTRYKETIFAKTFQDEQTASNLLLTAEKLATIAHLLGRPDYPGAAIADGWKWLARSSDHNYFGYGGKESNEMKIHLREQAMAAARGIVDGALPFIAERVQVPAQPCIPTVVFNPLSWRRTGLVDAHATFYPDNNSFHRVPWADAPGADALRTRFKMITQAIDTWPIGKNDELVLEDSAGKRVDFQKTLSSKEPGKGQLYFEFLAEDVPPLGYKTYYLRPVKTAPAVNSPLRASAASLENEHLRVSLDPATGSYSILDKRTGETLAGGLTVEADGALKLARTEVVAAGPVRAAVRLVYTAGHPAIQSLSTELTLTRQDRLDIQTTVKYDDAAAKDAVTVYQLFPLPSPDAPLQYGVPYGRNSMAGLRPGVFEEYAAETEEAFNSVDLFKTSRIAQQWVDVGGAFTIATNRRMFKKEDGRLRFFLFGISPNEPERAEILRSGTVISRFALIPRAAKSYRSGWEINTPLLSYTIQNAAGGRPLPASLSFLSSSAENSVVTVLKKSERGEGLVVRLYEAEGRPATFSLDFFRPLAAVSSSNLLEEPESPVSLSNIPLRPDEIKTLTFSIPSER